VKRSKHNLSHYKLFSCDMGELIPCGLTEVLPGDTVQHATSALVRFAPLVSPVMHPVHCRIHHWFVPHRLVWEDFEDFITGGPDGDDASVFPTITFGGGSGAAIGSLADYLGVPTGVDGIEVSALPFRGYALIFNEWYRDQDLVTELTIDVTSGADSTTSTALQQISWERDYFTTSRPWEQKGTAVSLPLGTSAPISGIGKNNQTYGTSSGNVYEPGQSSATDMSVGNSWSGLGELRVQDDGTGFPAIVADLSNATAASINELREAFALQRYQEARARYGSRYTEYLRYLGVRSSDARLQRPEYCGGGRQTIQFSEVLQTAEGGSTPVGNLLGHGIGALRTNRYRKFFEEHGYVFSFLSVRPKTMYIEGLPRHWNRRVKEDFWQKELQHIGQQEVLNKEVYAAHATPEGVFGYQDRYDEYRRTWSSISGEFRDSTLNFWHMARDFSSDPALNSTFVECVPTDRNFASSTNDTLYVMANHKMVARRAVAPVGNSYIY
jgi:hypothetical protein